MKVEELIEYLRSKSTNSNAKEQVIEAIKNSNPQLVAFGESNHVAAEPLRNFIVELLPELKDLGFSVFAFEIHADDDVFEGLEKFIEDGDIENIASVICDPNWTAEGRLMMYCRNAWLTEGFYDELRFMPDFERLLTTVRNLEMQVECIDTPEVLQNRKEPAVRDPFMADKLSKLLQQGKKIVWLGGCRHTMIPRRDGISCAQLLSEATAMYRVTGLTGADQLPPLWSRPTHTISMQSEHLMEIIGSIDNPVFCDSTEAQIREFELYRDENENGEPEPVTGRCWDSCVFFPILRNATGS